MQGPFPWTHGRHQEGAGVQGGEAFRMGGGRKRRGTKEGSMEGGPAATGAAGSGFENKNFLGGGSLERAGGTEPEKLHVPAAACAVCLASGEAARARSAGARGGRLRGPC